MKIEVDGQLVDAKRGDTLSVEFWYPRNEDSAKFVELGLSDVRAADNIRIFYDFERDGWIVQQASVFAWKIEDEKCDPDWHEVSFIKAWAREKINAENLFDPAGDASE